MRECSICGDDLSTGDHTECKKERQELIESFRKKKKPSKVLSPKQSDSMTEHIKKGIDQ